MTHDTPVYVHHTLFLSPYLPLFLSTSLPISLSSYLLAANTPPLDPHSLLHLPFDPRGHLDCLLHYLLTRDVVVVGWGATGTTNVRRLASGAIISSDS